MVALWPAQNPKELDENRHLIGRELYSSRDLTRPAHEVVRPKMTEGPEAVPGFAGMRGSRAR